MWKYSWIAAAVTAADQLAKILACRLTEPVVLIPGILGLTYAENTGMAFSMLAGQTWLLGVLSALLIAGGLLLVRRHELSRFSICAAMMMLGGAVGNMIDRFVHGYVVDMIEILAFRFPIFNVADTFLTIGCVMTAYALLFRRDDWREKHHGNTKGNDI